MKQKNRFYRTRTDRRFLSPKAVRQYYPDYEIVAFDKNKEALPLQPRNLSSMWQQPRLTIISIICNYIFLCAPVASNTAYLKQLTEYLDDDCILTDVGR